MTPDPPPMQHEVTEDELHAFIDGQLPASRDAAVRVYLAANPQEAARVNTYIAQRQALRAAFSDLPPAAFPAQLRLSRIAEEAMRRRNRFTPWQMAAAVVIALGLGAFGGWLAGQPPRQAAA